MLTRFVRIQLTVFIIAGVTGLAAMFFQYMQVPTLLGIGRLTVKLELADTGGLYRFSNVTYRGVQIGKVTAVGPTATGAEATLSIDTSPKIPADVHAGGAQHFGGGRAVRGLSTALGVTALPARRVGDRGA